MLLHLHLLYELLLDVGIFKYWSDVHIIVDHVDYRYLTSFLRGGQRALSTDISSPIGLTLPYGYALSMICYLANVPMRCPLAHSGGIVLHCHNKVESLLLILKLGGESAPSIAWIRNPLTAM